MKKLWFRIVEKSLERRSMKRQYVSSSNVYSVKKKALKTYNYAQYIYRDEEVAINGFICVGDSDYVSNRCAFSDGTVLNLVVVLKLIINKWKRCKVFSI